MNLFENCLLACDIDGTLMINGDIPAKNIEKIRYFTEQGGHFALSTGRTVGAVNMVLRKIPQVGASVVSNGSMIYDFNKEKVLHELCIPKSEYQIAKQIMDLNRDIGIEAHSGRTVLVLHETDETIDHQRYEELVPTCATFEEARAYRWNKVVYLFSNEEDLAVVKELVAKQTHNCTFVDTTTTFFNRKRNYYEQVPNEISKASALKMLCEKLGIPKGNYYAIGDYYNDSEMIKFADIGAAPADSPEDIKAQAKFIAGAAADGAVADFIDYLTNIRKGCK